MKTIYLLFFFISASLTFAESQNYSFLSYLDDKIDRIAVQIQYGAHFGGSDTREALLIDYRKSTKTIIDLRNEDPFSMSLEDYWNRNGDQYPLRSIDILSWEGALQALRNGKHRVITGGLTGYETSLYIEFFKGETLLHSEDYNLTGTPTFWTDFIDTLKLHEAIAER